MADRHPLPHWEPLVLVPLGDLAAQQWVSLIEPAVFSYSIRLSCDFFCVLKTKWDADNSPVMCNCAV